MRARISYIIKISAHGFKRIYYLQLVSYSLLSSRFTFISTWVGAIALVVSVLTNWYVFVP